MIVCRLISSLSVLLLFSALSCSPWQNRTPLDGVENNSPAAGRADNAPIEFVDQTEEIVGHAKKLIEKRHREGAVLDERWYTLKRLQNYQEAIFNAAGVVFYGGLETHVRRHLQDRYRSVVPIDNDQEPGDIRLFYGLREGDRYDVIMVGQNGREVALKTVIRLIYLAELADDNARQNNQLKLQSLFPSLRVFMSSVSARKEFNAFFNRHGIRNPDAVMIGFRGDIRPILRSEGVQDPKSYSDESLRVNWYPDANGRKLLLVSIDENRIFGSRAGALLDAVFDISDHAPPAVCFFGIGGAIDEPELVGRIVRPTIVIDGDPFPAAAARNLVHLIRNQGLDRTEIKTAHASVESVIVETTQWAHKMKTERVRTVDQELFHVMRAIHSSPRAGEVAVFAGILVTDNISTDATADSDLTLEYAEETIAKTAERRKEFLTKILRSMGVVTPLAPGRRKRIAW